MSFSRLFARCLPLLVLVPALTLADNDRNFKIAPNFFQKGVPMHVVADMPITLDGGLSLSDVPMIPLKPNTLYLRQKMGPKEFLWLEGQVNPEHYGKLHAFSLKDNYLKSSEVIGMRFYGTSNSKAFLDEREIYFDKEYIYSSRISRLFFRKNDRWQMLQESDLPGMISIKRTDPALEVVSVTKKMDKIPDLVYPVRPGMYAFSFAAPNHLPYVEAVSVPSGSIVEITPVLQPVDTTELFPPKTSVTLEMVEGAKSLEETEALYDRFTAELQKNVALVDTNDFAKIYPVIKKPLSLSVAGDDSAYNDYRIRFNQKRREALEIWRSNKMGNARYVNNALRSKMDSLQALSMRGSLVPSRVEPIYLQESDSSQKMVGVRIDLGRDHERYDVSWSGNAEGYSPESLYTVMTSGARVRAIIDLANNKPVWIHKDGVLAGRYQYRYVKFELEIEGVRIPCHGGYELPGYIFEQIEVQDWLNRPVEAPAQAFANNVEQPKAETADDGLGITLNENVPRIIQDKLRGNVALIDSGSFRYYGKVVSMSPFAIQTTEVSQMYFKEVMDKLDSNQRFADRSKHLAPRKPVHNINWDDARKFCLAIGGDLPTEAQWEFAGRADNNEGALWNLDENTSVDDFAVYRENSYKKGAKSFEYGPQPVGSKKPNPWGIYDMSGNVAEWTLDKYFVFSFVIEDSNPTGSLMGTNHVFKGGSWMDKEAILNLTERDDEDPRYWSETIGFRCAFPRSVFESVEGK